MLVAIPLSHPEFARSTCIRPAAPLNGAASITVQIGPAVVRLADVASQCGWCVLPNSIRHRVAQSFSPSPAPRPLWIFCRGRLRAHNRLHAHREGLGARRQRRSLEAGASATTARLSRHEAATAAEAAARADELGSLHRDT